MCFSIYDNVTLYEQISPDSYSFSNFLNYKVCADFLEIILNTILCGIEFEHGNLFCGMYSSYTVPQNITLFSIDIIFYLLSKMLFKNANCYVTNPNINMLYGSSPSFIESHKRIQIHKSDAKVSFRSIGGYFKIYEWLLIFCSYYSYISYYHYIYLIILT